MKVFISWSGPLSRQVAESLKLWVQCVIQAAEPFLSSEDIDKGAVWFGEIGQQLAASAPNPAGAVDAPTAFLFAIVRHGRRATDQRR
jgi:hypothetical protein